MSNQATIRHKNKQGKSEKGQEKANLSTNLPKGFQVFDNSRKQRVSFKGISRRSGRIPKMVQHKG